MPSSANFDTIRRTLTTHPLFQVLPDDVLGAVIQRGRTVNLPPGEVLFRKGDVGDFLFCVLTGEIQIGVSGHVMNTLPPGSVFGEIALLDDLPRSADAVASGNGTTQVFLVTRGDFQQLFLHTSTHHEAVIRLVCERARWTSNFAEERARAEASERLRLADKERMEGLLRQWMSDIAHELRTPISVLQGQIEAMQDGLLEATPKQFDSLHQQVTGLSRLVEDLHTLARADAGQLDCATNPAAPLDLLDGVVGAFRRPFEAAGLAIEWTAPEGGGPVVRGDPARLRQIFANLLQNSLRYTDSGGRLNIAWRAEGGHLGLTFDDTAPSVPVESLPRLFERFYRAPGVRSGGTGIGLAVTRNLVEAHGGRIEASPSPLGGLRISVALPLA